jgi:plastocyanin
MTRLLTGVVGLALCTGAFAQEVTVRGKIDVVHEDKAAVDDSGTVVWLTPTTGDVSVHPGPVVRLIQKSKQFTPHVLAITQGSTIEFPNQDPFFHDVFSIYHGKPFDLGLYEGGAVRRVVFSRPGISYIFCNIHPEMNAIVVVTRTPYFAVTRPDGSFEIAHVLPGKYKLDLWYEFASDAELASLSRQVEVSADESSLGSTTVHSSVVLRQHLNKYGEPYSPEKASY